MRWSQPDAEAYVPDGGSLERALAAVSHLAIGAHPDDLEIMAFHGILAARRDPEVGFAGIVCTDGARSPRAGEFADATDEEMRNLRRREQREAARVGAYRAVVQLQHRSPAIKGKGRAGLLADLRTVLSYCQPEVVYLHNPFDRHPTHLAVLAAALSALRGLDEKRRPDRVLGCEVWRGLDWLSEADKVVLDVSGDDELARRLLHVFRSQLAGGKRYDEAEIGRRSANATYRASHDLDAARRVTLALDLAPLLRGSELDLDGFCQAVLARFDEEVSATWRAAGWPR